MVERFSKQLVLQWVNNNNPRPLAGPLLRKLSGAGRKELDQEQVDQDVRARQRMGEKGKLRKRGLRKRRTELQKPNTASVTEAVPVMPLVDSSLASVNIGKTPNPVIEAMQQMINVMPDEQIEPYKQNWFDTINGLAARKEIPTSLIFAAFLTVNRWAVNVEEGAVDRLWGKIRSIFTDLPGFSSESERQIKLVAIGRNEDTAASILGKRELMAMAKTYVLSGRYQEDAQEWIRSMQAARQQIITQAEHLSTVKATDIKISEGTFKETDTQGTEQAYIGQTIARVFNPNAHIKGISREEILILDNVISTLLKGNIGELLTNSPQDRRDYRMTQDHVLTDINLEAIPDSPARALQTMKHIIDALNGGLVTKLVQQQMATMTASLIEQINKSPNLGMIPIKGDEFNAMLRNLSRAGFAILGSAYGVAGAVIAQAIGSVALDMVGQSLEGTITKYTRAVIFDKAVPIISAQEEENREMKEENKGPAMINGDTVALGGLAEAMFSVVQFLTYYYPDAARGQTIPDNIFNVTRVDGTNGINNMLEMLIFLTVAQQTEKNPQEIIDNPLFLTYLLLSRIVNSSVATTDFEVQL